MESHWLEHLFWALVAGLVFFVACPAAQREARSTRHLVHGADVGGRMPMPPGAGAE